MRNGTIRDHQTKVLRRSTSSIVCFSLMCARLSGKQDLIDETTPLFKVKLNLSSKLLHLVHFTVR